MFPADFISGSRDVTQHLTSGELLLIHSVDAYILVQIACACAAKNPFEPRSEQHTSVITASCNSALTSSLR